MYSEPCCQQHELKGGKKCLVIGVRPQFTKRFRDTEKGERQPYYFCPKHQGKHPDVSPITGEPRRREDAAYH